MGSDFLSSNFQLLISNFQISKMKTLFLIIVPIIILLGFAGYVYLGGFKEIEVTEAPGQSYLIAGIEYKGTIKDDSLEKVYRNISNLVLEEKVKGTFCAVQYIEPDNNEGKVHSLVGIIVNDSLASLPAGLKYHTFTTDKTVRAHITTHYAVAPKPEKVNEKIREFAKAKNLELDTITLEKYLGASEFMIEVATR